MIPTTETYVHDSIPCKVPEFNTHQDTLLFSVYYLLSRFPSVQIQPNPFITVCSQYHIVSSLSNTANYLLGYLANPSRNPHAFNYYEAVWLSFVQRVPLNGIYTRQLTNTADEENIET